MSVSIKTIRQWYLVYENGTTSQQLLDQSDSFHLDRYCDVASCNVTGIFGVPGSNQYLPMHMFPKFGEAKNRFATDLLRNSTRVKGRHRTTVYGTAFIAGTLTACAVYEDVAAHLPEADDEIPNVLERFFGNHWVIAKKGDRVDIRVPVSYDTPLARLTFG